MIDVYTNDTTRFSVGEKVNVIASASVGAKAVNLGFVIPLVIMMLSITIPILLFGLSEALAALIGLASLVPYYILLYRLRNRMQKVLVFQIEKLMG
jgi:sigma-E factor negative regulatory protein RseC